MEPDENQIAADRPEAGIGQPETPTQPTEGEIGTATPSTPPEPPAAA